jgi:hypothetical protein
MNRVPASCSALKMESISSPETSANLYQTIRRYVPHDSNLNIYVMSNIVKEGYLKKG